MSQGPRQMHSGVEECPQGSDPTAELIRRTEKEIACLHEKKVGINRAIETRKTYLERLHAKVALGGSGGVNDRNVRR